MKIGEQKIGYVVYDENNKHFVRYTFNRHGKFAKPLAELTVKTGKKYKNYFEIDGDQTVIYYYSKSEEKYYKILVTSSDYENIKDKYWSIKKDKQNIYAITFVDRHKKISLHRCILQPDDDTMVDHIDGNGLNNTRNNLRLVNNSINQKNLHHYNKGTTGVIGVQKEGNIRYKAMWTDSDGKNHTKSFSIAKYGEEEAFRLACETRLKNANKDNGYI